MFYALRKSTKFHKILKSKNPQIPINLEFDKTNYKISEKAIISFIGKPSEELRMMIINPSGSINGEDILIKLREDGRTTYELDLTGFTSGIYTAVVQKGNSQSSEKFSVGLQISSGPIEAKTTQTEYIQGEQILLIGSTNPNALLKVALIDSNGVKLKSIEIPSNSEGSFTVDKFKIPTNAIVGKWKIEVNSGSNSDTVEFEVNSINKDGITINIGEITKIPGFGDSINIGIIANQKTSITMQVLDSENNQIGENISCSPTAEFKCQIIWTIPDQIIAGIYTIKVSDSINSVERDIELK